MAITLTYNTETINLSEDLHWSDEYAWTPIAQTRQYSAGGALIVEEATRQAGRPITLSGHNREVWVTRAELEALRAWLAADAQMALTLHDARQFTVRWDHASNTPIDTPGTVLGGLADPVDADWYVINNLKFIEVQ